jgi:hypothetical protein
MSYLAKFAQTKGKEKTKPMTFRLPESLHDDFTNRCNDLNIKVADALRLLVEREMSSSLNGPESHLDTTPKQFVDKRLHNEDVELHNVTISKPNVDKPKRRTQTDTKRFNYTPWKIDGEVPCPICNKWLRSNKFARHVDTVHKMKTEEIFTDETHLQVTNKMVQQRKKEQSLSHME